MPSLTRTRTLVTRCDNVSDQVPESINRQQRLSLSVRVSFFSVVPLESEGKSDENINSSSTFNLRGGGGPRSLSRLPTRELAAAAEMLRRHLPPGPVSLVSSDLLQWLSRRRRASQLPSSEVGCLELGEGAAGAGALEEQAAADFLGAASW